jgi:hypothetical protein
MEVSMPKPGNIRLVSNSERPKPQPPVLPASKVRLRNKQTGEETLHATVDGIEILNAPGTSYELVSGCDYQESFLRRVGRGSDEPPPEAA